MEGGAATAVVADSVRDWLQLRGGDTGQAKKSRLAPAFSVCSSSGLELPQAGIT
jgi:hypothetical protein